MSSLIAHNTEPDLRPSTQGFLQGIHHGFGKFCGAVFGGMLIKELGNKDNQTQTGRKLKL